MRPSALTQSDAMDTTSSRNGNNNVLGDKGHEIRERRERHKLTKSALARKVGIHRDTLTDIEAGAGYQDATMAKILEGLDELDEEAGLVDQPESATAVELALVEFEVFGPIGVRVVVKGPIKDIEALERSVTKLVQAIRSERDETTE